MPCATQCNSGAPCLGQQAAAQEDGERVAAGVGVACLQDLDAAVREGVQAVGAPVAVQRAAVVPHAVEAQHLAARAPTFIYISDNMPVACSYSSYSMLTHASMPTSGVLCSMWRLPLPSNLTCQN